MAPPIPFPNTGFLNFLQQSVQGTSLIPGGGSVRRPFKLQYSNKASIGMPFGILGDTPIGIEEMQFEMPPKESGLVKRGLAKLKKAVIDKLEKSKYNQFPVIGSPTPFIDLKGGPRDTTYYDHIAKTGVESELEDFFTGESQPPLENEGTYINQGDFYVRIKDLRANDFIYFRGYVTGITENLNPSWTSTNYIGRSEPVFIYERATRDISFSLKLFAQSQIELKHVYQKLNRLTSLCYPAYVEDANLNNKTRMKPPLTKLRIGELYGKNGNELAGHITALTYTWPDTGVWETNGGERVPKNCQVNVTFRPMHSSVPSLNFYNETGEMKNEGFFGFPG